MLKIHKPYKTLVIIGTLFVSGALLVGYSTQVNTSSSSVYAADEDFSTEYRTISDIEYMQDMNQQICSNTNLHDTAILKDNRSAGYSTGTMTGPNGETHNLDEYVVVKLEDGNCWMQENLRLKAPAGGLNLTGADSDVSSWHMPATLIGNSTTDKISEWANSDTTPYSADLKNMINGVYYNWTAAIAMSDSSSTPSGDVNNSSICPKSWKLPSRTEFNDMIKVPSATSNITLEYAGLISNGSLDYSESGGYYWSRTTTSIVTAYYLNSYSGGNASMGNNSRFLGASVRCIATGGLKKNEKPLVPPSSKNGNIAVNVTPTITLDVSNGVTVTAEADKVATGTIEATITSNSDYDVLLSAKEPRLLGKENAKNFIPPTSVEKPVQPGNDAWGILNASGLYSPITTTPSPFDNTPTTSGNSKTHTFNVGISISPSLPADTYSTEVTVTATTK